MLQVKFRKRNKEETAESYFLAGRSLVWWMVGGSLFASNIGGSQFIGVSGDAAATGIAVVSYEWQVLYVVGCGGTRWDITSFSEIKFHAIPSNFCFIFFQGILDFAASWLLVCPSLLKRRGTRISIENA